MFFLAHQHERIMQLAWLQSAVRGVVAGFIGVLFGVTLQFARQSIINWKTAILAAVALVVLVVAKKNPLGDHRHDHRLAVFVSMTEADHRG